MIVRTAGVTLLFILFLLPIAASAQDNPAYVDQVNTTAASFTLTTEDGTDIQINPSIGGEVTRPEVLNLWPNGALFPEGSAGPGSEGAIYQGGDGNFASITQNGTNHLAVVVHEGNSNFTDVTQNGSDHVAGIRLNGDDNQFRLTQDGSGHRYLLDFGGSNLNHEVVQNGVDNTAVQIGEGSMPFGIEQNGSGMTMIIRHNVP